MKQKLLMLNVLIMLVSGAVFAQAKPAYRTGRLVEKVTRKGDELVIPYEKYVLPNGLTLIIHEDHSDPIAHIDVTYHVGSAREEIGKSGFAHFFELIRRNCLKIVGTVCIGGTVKGSSG